MVGHSIDRYGKEAGIAEDYLIEAPGSRIALVCGTYVACKHEPQRRQVLHEIDCRSLAQFITLNTGGGRDVCSHGAGPELSAPTSVRRAQLPPGRNSSQD